MPTDLGDLAAGTVLAGRYRLEEPLGRGSTAHVWRARDRELGRVVAVKLLGDAVHPELRARFGREGSILGRLSHPNLVAVHGTGLDGDRPFLVMDFVDGTAFSDVLAGGPLPWAEAAATVADVAAGLGEAHRAGVCHRDVKPANVVCGNDGVPRLVDFGIARAPDITTMTRADIVLGTSSYLSPEQAQALPVSPAADVYSLGCVLFEAVSGRPPFEGDGPLQVALKHINEEAPALSSVAPGEVPAGLDAVVARCLAKSPSDRYPSAAELEADLRRVVAGEAPVLAGVPAADEADEGATTAIPVAAVAAAEGTMVLPAVDVAPSGEVIDPSPLAEERPAASTVTPLSLPSLPPEAGPWRNLALAVGALLLVALLATAAFGDGGVQAPSIEQTPASADEAPPTTVTTAPPTTVAPPPTEAPAPPAKGKGKKKGGDEDDD